MVRSSENASQGPLLTSEESEQVREGARWLRRAANPFKDFYNIITIGAVGSSMTTETARRRNDQDVQKLLKDLNEIQCQMYTEDFDQFIHRLPFLAERLESNISSKVIKKIMHLVQSKADGGKHSDTRDMKKEILGFIPKKYFPNGGDGDTTRNVYSYINCPAPTTTKAWRGFGHVLTARLLCPVDLLDTFKADPDGTREGLNERRLALLDSQGDPKLPVFLYDEELMDDTTTKGLFRGPLLLAVYTHIFKSPSAATGTKRSSKRGNADKHGMTEVLPSTICYAAIQAYVALCSIDHWSEKWGEVDFQRLYNLLREHLAHPNDPWCIETMKWWNSKYCNSHETEDLPEVRDMQGPSMRERMEAERQARMQAAALTGS